MKYIGSSEAWNYVLAILANFFVRKIYSKYFGWPQGFLAHVCIFLFLLILAGIIIAIVPMIFKICNALISNIFKQKNK